MALVHGECWCGAPLVWAKDYDGLDEYDAIDLPRDVALEFDGAESYCEECHKWYTLNIPQCDYVVMQIERVR